MTKLSHISFLLHPRKVFKNLASDHDFTDVTLVSSDCQQIKAHKVILSSYSCLFKTLLIQNIHPHPLIVIQGVNINQLKLMIKFMYLGEVEVPNEELDGLLEVANNLKIEGLTSSGNADNVPGKQPVLTDEMTEKSPFNIVNTLVTKYSLEKYSSDKGRTDKDSSYEESQANKNIDHPVSVKGDLEKNQVKVEENRLNTITNNTTENYPVNFDPEITMEIDDWAVNEEISKEEKNLPPQEECMVKTENVLWNQEGIKKAIDGCEEPGNEVIIKREDDIASEHFKYDLITKTMGIKDENCAVISYHSEFESNTIEEVKNTTFDDLNNTNDDLNDTVVYQRFEPESENSIPNETFMVDALNEFNMFDIQQKSTTFTKKEFFQICSRIENSPGDISITDTEGNVSLEELSKESEKMTTELLDLFGDEEELDIATKERNPQKCEKEADKEEIYKQISNLLKVKTEQDISNSFDLKLKDSITQPEKADITENKTDNTTQSDDKNQQNENKAQDITSSIKAENSSDFKPKIYLPEWIINNSSMPKLTTSEKPVFEDVEDVMADNVNPYKDRKNEHNMKQINKMMKLGLVSDLSFNDLMNSCDICDYKVNTWNTKTAKMMSTHRKACHDNLQFTCKICQKEFTKRESMREHMKSVHSGRILPCDDCSYTTNRTTTLKEHTTKWCKAKFGPNSVYKQVTMY